MNICTGKPQIGKLAVCAAAEFANVFAILHPAMEVGTKIHCSIPFFIFLPSVSFRLPVPFEKCISCMAAVIAAKSFHFNQIYFSPEKQHLKIVFFM